MSGYDVKNPPNHAKEETIFGNSWLCGSIGSCKDHEINRRNKNTNICLFFGNMYREDDGSQSHLFSDLYNLIVYLFQPQNMSPVATHMHILPVKLKCL